MTGNQDHLNMSLLVLQSSNIQNQNVPNELKITAFGRHERMGVNYGMNGNHS